MTSATITVKVWISAIAAVSSVPLVAKEKLPEIAERQVIQACEQKIPQLVNAEARGAVANELNLRIKPLMDAELRKMRKVFTGWILVTSFVLLIAIVFLVVYVLNYGPTTTG